MAQAAVARKEDTAPASDAVVRLSLLIEQASYAVFSADTLIRDATAADGSLSASDAAYGKYLAIDGVERLTAFCQEYKNSPEHRAVRDGDEVSERPIIENPDMQSALRDCMETLAECDVLGPAGAAIAGRIKWMLADRDPQPVGELEVHCSAAEAWLRAKPAKRAGY